MSIRIVADSSSDAESIDDERLTVLPLTVMLDGKSYLDRVDLTSQEFYEKIERTHEVPKTSQVNPFAYHEVFQAAHNAGEEVICICLSSTVSGTYESACNAAKEVGGDIYVVDSRQIAMGTNIQVHYALRMADQGFHAKEIAEELNSTKDRIHMIAAVDTLEYLRRSGRAPNVIAFVGDKLNIKPLFTLDNGRPKLIGKAPGWKACYRNFAKNMYVKTNVDFSKPICFAYTGLDNGRLMKYMEQTRNYWHKYIPDDELNITLAGSTIGTHVGPGAIGVAYYTKSV